MNNKNIDTQTESILHYRA